MLRFVEVPKQELPAALLDTITENVNVVSALQDEFYPPPGQALQLVGQEGETCRGHAVTTLEKRINKRQKGIGGRS
jgi:hypothetical protein